MFKIKNLVLSSFLVAGLLAATSVSGQAEYNLSSTNPEGWTVEPRRAPVCPYCGNRMDSTTTYSTYYVGTVPCHLGSSLHQDNKYELRVYNDWRCNTCGSWIKGNYHVERIIIECPD